MTTLKPPESASIEVVDFVQVLREAPLNVKYPEYGAVGDNATSDTLAVKRAYDACPSAGGEIYFPPGTYLCGNAASALGILTKTIHLLGDGPGASTIKNSGTDAQHFIWLKGAGSTVRNLTVDGQRSAQASNGGSAIQFSGSGSTPLTPTTDILIEGCEVKGGGFDAIGLTAASGFVVRDNVVRDVFDTGIDVVEGSRRGKIEGNTVYCAGRFGIALDTADSVNYGPVNDVRIAGNTVVMMAGSDVRYGILLQTAYDCEVIGNGVDLSAAGLQGIRFDNEFLRGYCAGNKVRGGTATTRGICVEGLTVQTKMVTVEGNMVRDVATAGQSGIASDNSIGVIVRGNLIENCKRGINFEGSTSLPASALEAVGNILRNCDIGVRFGGTTGANTGTVGRNHFLGTFTYRYATDSAWTINRFGEYEFTGSIDAATGTRAPLARESGSAPTMGVATLAAGTVTVATTAVTASSRIILTPQSAGGTPGIVRAGTKTAGTSFVINSSSGTDTSTVGWLIVEPG